MIGVARNRGGEAGTRRCDTRAQRAIGAGLIILAFTSSRAVYFARGVRFDTTTIERFSQLLDPALLRNRLAESVLYLHAQPPLYNLLTGVALKLAPQAPEQVLWPVFIAAGMYSALCLYFLLDRLWVSPIPAALLTTIIAISPTFVLYENWYFYPHLDVAWLLGSFAWLAASQGRPGWRLLLCAAHLTGLVLTRSLFHPLFFVLASLLLVALMAPGTRRRAAWCFAWPGSLVGLWCLKNLLIFGFFGTSSWATRNVAGGVADLLGANRIEAEARRGRLSPAAGRLPFESGEKNIRIFGLPDRPTGVAALDQNTKSVQHALNYNHWSIPPTAHYYGTDTRRLLATYPRTYLRGIVLDSVSVFFSPVDVDRFVARNRNRMAEAADVCDAVEQSSITHGIVGVGLLLAAACVPLAPRHRRSLFAFAFLTMGWVAFVGIFGDHGENYRFRYKVLWLGWGIAAAGYVHALRYRRRFAEPLRELGRRLRCSLARPGNVLLRVSAVLLPIFLGGWVVNRQLQDRFSVAASGSDTATDTGSAEQAIDGNPITEWLAPAGEGAWLELRFRRPIRVQAVWITNALHAPVNDRGSRDLDLNLYAGEQSVGYAAVKFRPIRRARETQRVEINGTAITRVRVTVRGHYGLGAGVSEINVIEALP